MLRKIWAAAREGLLSFGVFGLLSGLGFFKFFRSSYERSVYPHNNRPRDDSGEMAIVFGLAVGVICAVGSAFTAVRR